MYVLFDRIACRTGKSARGFEPSTILRSVPNVGFVTTVRRQTKFERKASLTIEIEIDCKSTPKSGEEAVAASNLIES